MSLDSSMQELHIRARIRNGIVQTGKRRSRAEYLWQRYGDFHWGTRWIERRMAVLWAAFPSEFDFDGARTCRFSAPAPLPDESHCKRFDGILNEKRLISTMNSIMRYWSPAECIILWMHQFEPKLMKVAEDISRWNQNMSQVTIEMMGLPVRVLFS